MNKLEIDDPMSYTQTNLVGGAWGILAIGLFHQTNGLVSKGSLELFFVQIVYLACAVAFGGLTSLCLWKTLDIFRLRIDHIYEVIGLQLQSGSKSTE